MIHGCKTKLIVIRGKQIKTLLIILIKLLITNYLLTVEEGYKVAKERDLLLIGKQLKEVYEKVESL